MKLFLKETEILDENFCVINDFSHNVSKDYLYYKHSIQIEIRMFHAFIVTKLFFYTCCYLLTLNIQV